MNEIAKQIAEIALEIGAIKLSPDKPFQWASGYYMPIYNDNRMLLGNAAHRSLVSQGFADYIQAKGIAFDVIAGTATAGIPPATTLADRLETPLIYVRSKAKGHGLENQIEGILNEGAKVLVVEDLVSTGGSSVRAVEAVRQAGGVVENCFSIFSYGLEKATTLFDEASCALFSLLTYDVLLEVAKERGDLSATQLQDLREWREAPFEWGTKRGYDAESK